MKRGYAGYRDPNNGRMYYSFRPPHGIARKPLKGGRWEVRKARYYDWGNARKWQAHTKGKARVFNAWFFTHREAMQWAQLCAWAYSTNNHEALNQLKGIKEYRSKHGIGSLTLVLVDGKIDLIIN